jgi:hypothetical protein
MLRGHTPAEVRRPRGFTLGGQGPRLGNKVLLDIPGTRHLLNPATSSPHRRNIPGIMISLQRFLVSALLILSVTFVFFAQSAEATKGPKITHKVRSGSILC